MPGNLRGKPIVSRRLVITGIAAAGVLGAVVPSFAQSSAQSLPVTVHTDTHNGVAVGVDIQGRPGVGAAVTPDGKACVGVSLQVPFCTPGGIIGGARTGATAQQLPPGGVVIRHDDNGTAIGVGNVGVIIEKDGTICPVVSTQSWRCIPGG
jgi:hypothetical protein